MDLSIIIPINNEEKNIPLLYQQIKKVIGKYDYEIIYIEDGSTDNSFLELKKLRNKTDRVKIFQFTGNFGKAAGLSVGFREAKGDVVITMDGDLQDDPKEIPRFIKKLDEGYDLVSGWKFKRHDPISKTLPSKFFNWLTSKVSGVTLHDFNCGFKAYRKMVVKNVRLYGELHRYIPVLAFWKGFKIGEITVTHHARKHGKSYYGSERLLKGFFDLITVKFLTKFTKRPLHFFGRLGLLSMLAGFISGVVLLYEWLFLQAKIGDRPLLMLTVLLIVLGVQFISLGLLGELFTSSKEEKVVIRREIK